MRSYSIAERQAIKDRLASEEHFDRDRELFGQLFPHHPLNAELARVNRVNKPSLCRRMIYQMLQKVDEVAILEWRESGARVANKQDMHTEYIRDDKPNGSVREKSGAQPAHEPVKKAGKTEEFPGINWLNNESEDIQLAILLYDERINTWHQMVALRNDIDECPEKAVMIAELDDRNRMAQHELEVFQDTGVFPCKHPIAVKFVAERKRLAELRDLKRNKPDEFMAQVTNARHNISRYRSWLKNKKKLTDERRKQIEENLANAIRLDELLQRVVKE